MISSTSPQYSGVVFDTNVLSLFARAGRLDLLQTILASARGSNIFFITPAIHNELTAGYGKGVSYLADVLELVNSGQIQISQMLQADQLFIASVPARLAAGEAEAIALCHRLHLVFITHDRKAINYCERVGIPAIRLVSLLGRLEKAGLISRDEVRKMLE